MKQYSRIAGFSLASVISLVTIQPAIAQIADIQNIQLYPTETGLDILLETETDLASQITITERDNTLQLEIGNAQLSLGSGEFRQESPNADIALKRKRFWSAFARSQSCRFN
ncbi:MAG: hypothetical protein ACLFT0_13450 [Spirulinaceae cyanobacterium]